MKKEILILSFTIAAGICCFTMPEKKAAVSANSVSKVRVKQRDANIDVNKYFIETFNKPMYDSIKKAYIHENRREDLFLYSTVIAYKWKDAEAAYDAFTILAKLDEKNKFKKKINLDFLDPKSIELAISFLKIASDSGQSNAKYLLGNYLIEGKYLPKDSLRGQKLIKEANVIGNGIFK